MKTETFFLKEEASWILSEIIMKWFDQSIWYFMYVQIYWLRKKFNTPVRVMFL